MPTGRVESKTSPHSVDAIESYARFKSDRRSLSLCDQARESSRTEQISWTTVQRK